MFWEMNTLDETEALLKDIREEIRKTDLTLGEILKELKAYVVFRKAQKNRSFLQTIEADVLTTLKYG